MKIKFRVNGKRRSVSAAPETPLLYVLRNDLQLDSPKFGCGLGQCGACTVLIGNEAVRSCLRTLQSVNGKDITTVEGLGNPKHLHPLQQAFLDEQAAQCGYCISGMIMTSKALLDKNPHPTEQEIRNALAGNLCRCGAHLEILRAVQRVTQNRGAL